MFAKWRLTVFSLRKTCSATCLLVAPPAIRVRMSTSRLVKPPGDGAAGLRTGSAPLAVDAFGGGGVRISGLVLAERGMRFRHPLVNLRGLVAALLGPVFPQCRMQRVERRTVLSARNEECAPRVSRPCPKSRSPEF